jgi:tetratricopeptide (TPR) repeat protein
VDEKKYVVMGKTKFHTLLCLCLILIIVSAAFYPCLKCGFVNWDDDDYVVNNTSITSVSFSSLKAIFTSFSVAHYQPLTIISYLVDYQFYKLQPFGYHLTNLILHLLNCLLVFWFIYLISKNIAVSFLTALLFGIHPLRVESVAWVSERKDVLYSFFYLSSLISYIYYLFKGKNSKFYLLSLFLFLCSLLSKSMAVTLPVILLLVDYYLKRKPEKSVLLDKIPYFILALVTSVIVVFGIILFGVIRSEANYSFLSILSVASHGIVFYLGKLFLPLKLSCLYPYYSFQYNFTYLCSIITVILLIFIVILSVKYTRKLFFAGAFFLITLLPILQFIPTNTTIVADRYTYMSSIGIFFIISSLIYWLYSIKLKTRLAKFLLVAIAVYVLATLSFLTFNRCKVWKDGVALWGNVLKNYPNSAEIYNNRRLAYNNLGAAYIAQRENDKAIFAYKKAIEADPYYAESYNNLGAVLLNKKEYDKALIVFIKALEIDPEYMKAHANLCAAYGIMGNFKEAIKVCGKAVELDPFLAQAHYNLSVAYYFNKQYDLAARYLQTALKLGWKPDPAYLKVIEPHLKTRFTAF